MMDIDKPEDDQTPDADGPEPRAGGLPTRGGRTTPGSQPAGFEPLAPIAKRPGKPIAKPIAKPEPTAKPKPITEPTTKAEPIAKAEPPARPAVPIRPPAPTLGAAELAAKREARGARGYTTARTANPGRAATADAAPQPEPAVAVAVPPSTPGVKPTVKPKVLIAIAACAVLVVAGAAVVLVGGDDEKAPAPSAGTTTGAEAPESLEFQPPVRLTSNTEHIETETLPDGNLLVTHWVRSSQPMTQLSISVPVTPDLDEHPVEVTDLVVAADGVRLDASDSLVSDGTSTSLPDASDLYVQYHLAGTLQRSGSTQGRALATMTSLDVQADPDVISRTQVFPGTQVLSVACLAPNPTALPRPCGSIEEGEWTVVLPADALRDTVIVQFDLDA